MLTLVLTLVLTLTRVLVLLRYVVWERLGAPPLCAFEVLSLSVWYRVSHIVPLICVCTAFLACAPSLRS